MMTDFDQDLKQSLTTQASRVPQSYELGRDAIVRARGIRRRRRVVGGVAFAAVLAIAVPVGLQVGDAVPRGDRQIAPATTEPAPPPEITGPTRIDMSLASLPLSDEPPLIPYIDGRTMVAGDERYEVDAKGDIRAAAVFNGGAHLYINRDNVVELVRITPQGTGQLGAAAGFPLASADLRWNAYAIDDGQRGVTLTLFDSQESTAVSSTLTKADGVDLHAVVGGTVYFRPILPNGTKLPLQSWAAGEDAPTVVPGSYAATAVSSDGRLIADLTKVTDFGTQTCSDVVDQAASGATLWTTCKNQVLGFGPDGLFAWAGPEYADGYAPVEIAILDARTGEVIRKLQGPGDIDHPVFFMAATFEDEDHLLIRAEQDGQTALVRCTVSTGECELAVPTVDGTSLEGDGSPYLLAES